MEKIIPTPSHVGILILTSWDVLCPVGEIKPTQHFCALFSRFVFLTFATNPRVVESFIGLAPMEQPHKQNGHTRIFLVFSKKADNRG